jgi:hypothetical protein
VRHRLNDDEMVEVGVALGVGGEGGGKGAAEGTVGIDRLGFVAGRRDGKLGGHQPGAVSRRRGADDELGWLAVGADKAEERRDPAGAQAVVAPLALGEEAVPGAAGDDDGRDRRDARDMGAAEPCSLTYEKRALILRQVRVTGGRRDREHFLSQRHGGNNLRDSNGIMALGDRGGNKACRHSLT